MHKGMNTGSLIAGMVVRSGHGHCHLSTSLHGHLRPSHVLEVGETKVSKMGPHPKGAHFGQGRETQRTHLSNTTTHSNQKGSEVRETLPSERA
jgi:hypothetical protein